MNLQLKSPNLAYFGFALGIIAAITGVFGWFPADAVWSIAGLFGFGGVAALRAYMKSNGWTTYAYAGGQVLNTILFIVFDWYDFAVYQSILGLLATLTGIGLANGYRKSIDTEEEEE